MPRPWFALVLVTACGRVSFEATYDGGAGAPDAATPAAFDPSAGTCIEAETGPFRELASVPTMGGGYGVWAAPPFVLAADTTGGLSAARFDGTSFAPTGNLGGLGWVEAVWSDGGHFYVGAPGTGLAVVDLLSDGSLALRTQTFAIAEARRGWISNGTLFVPSGGDGLFAARFDGVSLVTIGSPTASMGWAQGAWARGRRVLLADNDFVRVLDFDGTTFTDAIAPDGRFSGANRVWSDGDRVFVAHAGGVTALRIGATALTELDTFATAATARDIWSDGRHVFVAAESAGTYALDFVEDQFTELARVGQGGDALGVMGDGRYIYTNDLGAGLRAYAGFACMRW